MMKNMFEIPCWLAFRTYFFNTEKSRTIISNEYKHEYILLEGLSSDFWNILVSSKSHEEINSWAISHNINNQVDSFVQVLIQHGLLLDKTDEGSKQPRYSGDNETDETETAQFEADFKKWCFDNGFLYSLFIELTYACNLNCVHCFNPKGSKHQINFEEIKKIIDDAYDIGCFRLTLSGGEATLHKDFINIIKYARSKRMSVEFFTNGQLLNDNSSLFSEVEMLYPYRVGVSIYSMNEKEHDNVTSIVGSWKKVTNIARKLREHNINIQIKNFLLKNNYKGCAGVKKFAETIKANYVADLSLIPTIEGNKTPFLFEAGEKELFELYSDPDSPLFIKGIKLNDYSKIQSSPLCYGGFSCLSISPFLDVFPCCSMPYKLGSLKEKSLKEIWNNAIGSEEDSKLYKLHNFKGKDLKECYKNDYCKFCNYCPGMGMLENGFLKKSDILCRQAKVKMKVYEKMMSLV